MKLKTGWQLCRTPQEAVVLGGRGASLKCSRGSSPRVSFMTVRAVHRNGPGSNLHGRSPAPLHVTEGPEHCPHQAVLRWWWKAHERTRTQLIRQKVLGFSYRWWQKYMRNELPIVETPVTFQIFPTKHLCYFQEQDTIQTPLIRKTAGYIRFLKLLFSQIGTPWVTKLLIQTPSFAT